MKIDIVNIRDPYKRVRDLNPQLGDILISQDGEVVVLCTSKDTGIYLSSAAPGNACGPLESLSMLYRKATTVTMTVG